MDGNPAQGGRYVTRKICLHGPESTGKSTLSTRLAAHFDAPLVPEYGRTYCEQFGTDLSMDDLLAIAKTHDAMTQKALAQAGDWLILDTDPLMTAVWSDMLFHRRPPWFATWNRMADLYLLFDIDLPWIDDGTRFFGFPAERQRFMDLSRAELERRNLPWVLISGDGEERYANALAAIDAAFVTS